MTLINHHATRLVSASALNNNNLFLLSLVLHYLEQFSNTNTVEEKLQRIKMASTLTEREIDESRDAFNLFDTVGDGKIESSAIGLALRSVNLNPTQAEVDKVLREIDLSGKKRISFEEFLPIMQSCRSRTHKVGYDAFVDSLKVFDTDNNGWISSGELRHVLTGLGERLSDEDVDMLLQGFEDNQGLINYEDFVKNVMNG